MSLDTLSRTAAEAFKRRLLERHHERILEVRVFGSRARGEAHQESDLDVFVMVESPGKSQNRAQ